MGFFLENLSLSSWDLALYIIIVYLIISIVLYYATFYLKRKRLTKRKGEDIEQTSDEHSFLASIKSTRSSSLSTKTAKSEMARTQRESSRDGGGKSNAILHVRSTQISARLSDGKTPLLPDNVLPKVKMPREHYFEEWKEDVTQELTKSIRERERPPPLKTAADEASKSGVASTKDSESTKTQNASETSDSEGSSGSGNSSSSVTLSERGEVETSTNEGKTSTNDEETSTNEGETSTNEEETSTNEGETSTNEGENSSDETNNMREEGSDESSKWTE